MFFENNYIIIIYFYLVFCIDLKHLSQECCLNSSLYTISNHRNFIQTYYFNQFNELKFNCNSPIDMLLWELFPYKKLILNDSLNLTGLKINLNERYLRLKLYNLKGFDLESNPFTQMIVLNRADYRISLYLGQSDFNAYLNNSLIDKANCKKNLPSKTILTKSHRVSLKYSAKFSTQTCPFIFKNVVIYQLTIEGLSSSYIEVNILGFQNLTDIQLYATVFHFEVSLYRVDFNEQLLNKYVFKELFVLDLDGVINSIQSDLFKSFTKLKLLRLRSQNVKRIFARKNEWIEWLNFNSADPRDFLFVIYQAFSNVSFYEYPEEDFCYFKSFPHQRSVLAMLKPTMRSICSCTELFLIQYSAFKFKELEKFRKIFEFSYAYHMLYHDMFIENRFSKCLNASISTVLSECNFKKRLDTCNIKQANKSQTDELFVYVYDWREMVLNIDFFFNKYINLILSTLSIVVNTLFIVVLSDKKLLTDKMYNYLLVNAYFNLFYSIILTFKFTVDYLGKDLEFRSAISYYLTFESKQVFINCMIFFQNFFRTGSNLAYLAFALTRLIAVRNKNGSGMTQLIMKLDTKVFLLIVFILSGVINISIFFQIKNKKRMDDAIVYINASQYYQFEEPNDFYIDLFSSKTEYYLLNISQYLRVIFSDLVNIIASTVIDTLLYVFVKETLSKKVNLITPTEANKERLENLKKTTSKSLNRIIRMIILNQLNCILLRLPLAVLSFYGFVFRYDTNLKKHEPTLISYIICKYTNFCLLLSEVFSCFYLMSFLVQLIIFYKIDKNFRLRIIDMKNRILRRNESSQNTQPRQNLPTANLSNEIELDNVFQSLYFPKSDFRETRL